MQFALRGHEYVCWEDCHFVQALYALSGHGVDAGYLLHLVIPKLDAEGDVGVCGENIQSVALYAEPALDKVNLVTRI